MFISRFNLWDFIFIDDFYRLRDDNSHCISNLYMRAENAILEELTNHKNNVMPRKTFCEIIYARTWHASSAYRLKDNSISWATVCVGVVKNDVAAARREKSNGKVQEMRVQIAACLLNFTRLRAPSPRRWNVADGETHFTPVGCRI